MKRTIFKVTCHLFLLSERQVDLLQASFPTITTSDEALEKLHVYRILLRLLMKDARHSSSDIMHYLIHCPLHRVSDHMYKAVHF